MSQRPSSDVPRSVQHTWWTVAINPVPSPHPFEYTPLNNGPNSFRYLKLFPPGDRGRVECRIYHSTVNERKGLYKALSYTWGPPDTSRMILLNGRPLPVREHLFDFLEMYSKERATFDGVDLWIDAVCINQADISERNHQVRIMRDIYSQAEEVLAWLGPSTSESDFLLDFLNNASVNRDISNKFASYDEYLKILSSEHDTRDKLDKLSAAFADLDVRDYWSRIWIVQEIHLASRVVFWVGHRHINGLLLRLFLRDIDQYSTRFRPGTMQSIVTAIGTNEYTNLEDCIRRFGNLECQDSLDKVYALLGMVKEGAHDVATLEVKYENSTEELFARTLNYCRPKCPMDFALHLGSLLGVCVHSRNKGRWWLPIRGMQRSLTNGHPVQVCLHSSGLLAELRFVSNGLPTSPVQYIIPHAETGQNRGHESRFDPKPTSPTSVFMHKDASTGDLVFSIDAPRVVTPTLEFFSQPFKHGVSVSTGQAGPLKLSSVHLGCILDLSVQDWAQDVEILQIVLEQLGILEALCRASRFSIEIRAGRRILQISTQTEALMDYASSLETSAKAYHARKRTRFVAET